VRPGNGQVDDDLDRRIGEQLLDGAGTADVVLGCLGLGALEVDMSAQAATGNRGKRLQAPK